MPDNVATPISAQLNNGNSSSSGDFDSWVKLLALLEQSQNSKTKFKNVPMSPEQKQLYDYAFDRIKALPNTTAALAPYATSRALTSNPLDIAALKRGEVGYTPTGTMDRPPANLAGILGGGTGSGSTPTSPGGTSAGAPTTGVAGDPFGHLTSPAGSTGDPFGGMDTSASGNTDLSSVYQKGLDYIKSVGAGGKTAGMTGAIVAQYLGVPAILATAGGKAIAALWDRYIHDPNAVPDLPQTNRFGKDSGVDLTPKHNPGDPYDPSWIPKSNPRTPIQNPGNTIYDPMGLGDTTRFNNNLATDPGQIGSTTQGGDKGFGGYGMDYNDTPFQKLPGGPRGGGGSHGGGLV